MWDQPENKTKPTSQLLIACACVRVCVCMCVRVRACACVHAYVHACVDSNLGHTSGHYSVEFMICKARRHMNIMVSTKPSHAPRTEATGEMRIGSLQFFTHSGVAFSLFYNFSPQYIENPDNRLQSRHYSALRMRRSFHMCLRYQGDR